MKQAYLITAYKDFDTLYELAGMLTQTGLCFIHVDQKSKTITDADIEKLNQLEGCKAIRKYNIVWGGFAHVEAIFELLTMALAREEVSYVHLLTGEDYPLVSVKQLDQRFLGIDKDSIYLSYISPSELPETVIKRFRYYNLFQDMNVKNKVLWLIQDMTVQAQKLVGIKRKGIGEFRWDQIYKGLVYISMPRKAAKYVVSYVATHSEYWEDLKKCQVPEEFFFQTLFMNSKEFSDKVVNRELRYMDWTKGDGASPCYLESADYEKIMKEKEEKQIVFARKFHPTLSKELRERIHQGFTS